MPVNKDELVKDLDNPEYLNLVSETLKKKEFTVQSKDEHNTFRENFKKDVIEKEIPERINQVHNQYDKDVTELTGLKRETNEKTYDFVKRALKANNSDALKKEVDELKKQIAEGDKTGATQKALQEAESKYQKSLGEKDELIKKLQTENATSRTQSLLTNVYAGVKGKFIKTLPPMFDKSEKAILAEALGMAVVGDDGELYKGDGKGGIAKDTSFNPIKMVSHLEKEFDGVIDKAKKGGAGSKGEKDDKGGIDPDQITADNFVVPETVKTGGDLMDYMMEIGLKRGDKKFDEIWNKWRYTLPDAKGMKAPPAPAKK